MTDKQNIDCISNTQSMSMQEQVQKKDLFSWAWYYKDFLYHGHPTTIMKMEACVKLKATEVLNLTTTTWLHALLSASYSEAKYRNQSSECIKNSSAAIVVA